MLASSILSYNDFLKDSSEPLKIRLAIIKRYEELKSISAVALEFNTTSNTVRKWANRFKGHISSLKNHSKAPYLQIKDYFQDIGI